MQPVLTLRGAPSHTREKPFLARLKERKRLSKGTGKDIWHLAIDLKGSGCNYCSGDSLGIFPQNNPYLVEQLLESLGWKGDETVPPPNGTALITTYEALLTCYSLTHLSRKLLEWLASQTPTTTESQALQALLNPDSTEAFTAYLQTHDLLDLAQAFPHACRSVPPQAFLQHLRKLLPRLYSIACSPLMHPEEAHLTVSSVRYVFKERPREGVASTYLLERLPLNEAVLPVFIAPSRFRLPTDHQTPIIMIGPGTGVAPFRAFIQERSLQATPGKAWLFFGDRHQAYDFLYEAEWQHYQKIGALHRLDLAFSRDQAFKEYVQDKMRAQATEIWQWLMAGAHLYVCGDAKRMATDVEATLHQIIVEQGRYAAAEATSYLKQLKAQKRYQRDVY